jgi:foldase protein PrsA
LAVVLYTATPARAQEPDPFTVTGADGTVYGATGAELAHWTDVARRSGTPRRAAGPQAFQLLVTYAWLRAEAAERGIAVTHEQAVHRFRRQRDSAFPTRRAYRRFLRESGQTVDTLLFRVRMDMLSSRVRHQVVEGADRSITDTDVDAYLAEHGIPRVPERRDLRLVLTRERSTAVAAMRELRGGARWSSVVRRFSLDDTSRGGRRPDVIRRDLERPLRRAVFAARPRRLLGPVRTQFGYYVFRVTRVHPARDIPEAQARENARLILISEAQQTALSTFVADFHAKWQARTSCRPEWRSRPECGA